ERARALHLAMHLEARRRELDIALRVVEFDREPAFHRDAVDLLEEIEEPVAAMELPVGADLEPGGFLQSDRIRDRRALDLAQRRGIDRAALALLACVEDRVRPQQAADDIGF